MEDKTSGAPATSAPAAAPAASQPASAPAAAGAAAPSAAPAKPAPRKRPSRAAPAKKTAPMAQPSGLFDGKSIDELVGIYNGLARQAIAASIKGVAEVKAFPDEKTGRLACERLHAQINKPRDDNKEKPMSEKRTTSKARAGKKRTAAKAKKRAGTGTGRYAADAKITWLGKEIPFKEGTGAHERTVRAQKHNNKTVDAFVKAGGATSTLRTLEKLKLAKIG